MLTPTEAAADHHPRHHAVPVHAIVASGRFTRRDLLGTTALLAGAALTAGMMPAFAQKALLKTTTQETLGPFYPIVVPADQDADLTLIAGQQGRALGQLLYVSGKVTNTRGEPVADATLEIWQANAAGRYAHPADENKAPLDPNFQGYAKIRTAADGRYRFKTVKPAAYPTGAGDWSRPPHIHFDVRGRASRITTQMYFEGEALNGRDRLLQAAHNKETMLSRYVAPSGQQERDALVALWDIVLIAG